MPLYEYVSEQDGTVVELLRPAAEADSPVADPEGKGRTFRRVQSAFAARAGARGADAQRTGPSLPMAGGCACGRVDGPCRA